MLALRGSNGVAIEWGYEVSVAPVAPGGGAQTMYITIQTRCHLQNPPVFKEINRTFADFLGFYNTNGTWLAQNGFWP